MAADDDWVLDLTIYTAEAPSEDRLKLLASWAATGNNVTKTSTEPTR